MLYSICLLAALCAAAPPPPGEIALLAGTEQADLQVCLYNLSTDTLTPIGPGKRDGRPAWSPDGTQLAFSSWHPELTGLAISIYTMATQETRLISHQHNWCLTPRWSPEGNRLAYVTEHKNTTHSITVYDLERATEQYWAEEAKHDAGIKGFLHPAWLTDINSLNYLHADETRWLPFSAEAETHGVILAIAIVHQGETLSTEPYALTPSHALPLLPELSPDSHRFVEWCIEVSPAGDIAFESNDGGDREIFSLRQKDIANLSNHRAADWQPVWAHGGRFLLFESFRNGSRGIFHLDARTGRTAAIAASPAYNQWSPAWSPDDQWFVFIADKSGHPELFLSAIDGETPLQLTQENKLLYAPAWRPTLQENK